MGRGRRKLERAERRGGGVGCFADTTFPKFKMAVVVVVVMVIVVVIEGLRAKEGLFAERQVKRVQSVL